MGNKEHWMKNNQDAVTTNTILPGEQDSQEKKTIPRQWETKEKTNLEL